MDKGKRREPRLERLNVPAHNCAVKNFKSGAALGDRNVPRAPFSSSVASSKAFTTVFRLHVIELGLGRAAYVAALAFFNFDVIPIRTLCL